MKKILNATIPLNSLHFWLLLLRVGTGLLMLTHGWPKLQTLMAGNVQFPDPFGVGATASMGLAVFVEFFCSILLILGLATRFATIPLMITMLVAVFKIHASDPLGKKELAILYLLIFITLLVAGAGKYSLDGMIGNKKRR